MGATDSAERPVEPIFPRLTGGPGGMQPDQVARHQKARLEGAMVEAVARHGFAATTLRELVTLAGVSKSTFYQHFESKQDCFLATYDEISDQVSRRVGEAYSQPGEFRRRLVGALERFMRLVVEEPQAASLAVVESLTLGTAGVSHREKGWESFEQIAQQSLRTAQPEVEVSDVTVRAIIGGINGVVYRRLRTGRSEELPGLAEMLVDWGLGYQRPDGEAVRRAVAAAEQPAARAAEDDGEDAKPDWEEPPDSPRSRGSSDGSGRKGRRAASWWSISAAETASRRRERAAGCGIRSEARLYEAG